MLVDAVIDRRQVAARRGRRPVSSKAVSSSGLGSGSGAGTNWPWSSSAIDTMRLPVVDAGAHHLGDVAAHFQADAQHGAGLQCRRVEQLGDRLGHAGGIVADIAGVLESLRDLRGRVLKGMMSSAKTTACFVDRGARRRR